MLFVDDEPHVLDGIRRHLGRRVTVETATSGAEGLKLVEETGPYAVVVSDMRMPSMTGSQFLAKVREISPDSIRVILSGESDIKATIEAVNEGQIFRFLTKPCPPDKLWSVVEAGLNQNRLIHAEQELLEKTLSGAVRMLTEVLGLTSPVAFSRSSRVQRYAESIATALGVAARWEIRLAGMLSQIGCITLPPEILKKAYAAEALDAEETRLYASHPELAARLLASIPRLELVAEIVAEQMSRPNVKGAAAAVVDWDLKLLGRFILRAACELEETTARGTTAPIALQKLLESWPELPASVTSVLRGLKLEATGTVVRAIKLTDLVAGMVLDEDLKSSTGIRLVPQGQEVSHTLLVRLRTIASGVGVQEPFRVHVRA